MKKGKLLVALGLAAMGALSLASCGETNTAEIADAPVEVLQSVVGKEEEMDFSSINMMVSNRRYTYTNGMYKFYDLETTSTGFQNLETNAQIILQDTEDYSIRTMYRSSCTIKGEYYSYKSMPLLDVYSYNTDTGMYNHSIYYENLDPLISVQSESSSIYFYVDEQEVVEKNGSAFLEMKVRISSYGDIVKEGYILWEPITDVISFNDDSIKVLDSKPEIGRKKFLDSSFTYYQKPVSNGYEITVYEESTEILSFTLSEPLSSETTYLSKWDNQYIIQDARGLDIDDDDYTYIMASEGVDYKVKLTNYNINLNNRTVTAVNADYIIESDIMENSSSSYDVIRYTPIVDGIPDKLNTSYGFIDTSGNLVYKTTKLYLSSNLSITSTNGSYYYDLNQETLYDKDFNIVSGNIVAKIGNVFVTLDSDVYYFINTDGAIIYSTSEPISISNKLISIGNKKYEIIDNKLTEFVVDSSDNAITTFADDLVIVSEYLESDAVYKVRVRIIGTNEYVVYYSPYAVTDLTASGEGVYLLNYAYDSKYIATAKSIAYLKLA